MRRLAALLLLTAATVLAPATPALAIDCNDQAFTDAQGTLWETSSELSLRADNADALADLLDPIFERSENSYYSLPDPDVERCALEDSDRELRYPAVLVGDLEVSGTIYVPVGAPAFVRGLLILRNPNAEPAALPPIFGPGTEWGTTNTDVFTTTSGDTTADASDDWMVLVNGGDATDARIGLVWNFGAAANRRRSAIEVYDSESLADSPTPPYTGGAEPRMRFERTVVPPGGMATFLVVGLLRADGGAAQTAAQELQAAPEALLAGLSDEEKRALQNVGLPDGDLDGVANEADNCPFAVNGDQANLDGDGQGDACDDDVDGDGVADAVEAARGLDPRRSDTDGDGRPDSADACPLLSGLGADGCPRFGSLPPLPDTAAPGATIQQIGATMRRPAFFRRGVPCVVDLDEAAQVVCRLLVRATRVARIAAAGDLEVASRSLPLAVGRRSVRLRPRRRLIRQRRFRATLQVTAIDAAGNRAVARKRFRVR